jgi:3-hydroxyisobutyrate dehydrogenase
VQGLRLRGDTLNSKSYEPIEPRRVAFIGLGVMGAPMARHLAAAGHRLTVYNRTAEKARKWVEQNGGGAAATPREAAQDAELVFACVGNDDDVRAIALEERGALAGMQRGAVFVDHTTASAQLARELHAHTRAKGVEFIDAPISGGQSGAENGTLTVMCGGDPEPFERMRPLAMAYARAVTRVGPAGAGQLTKMVNQICIAGLVQGLAEALAFGEKAGLDLRLVLEVIGKGAAQSWQMDNRGRTMIENRFDFGFAVDWMRKDLGLVLEEARRNGARVPVAALVDQFYADIQAQGGNRWDTSSLIRRLTGPLKS